MNDNQQNTLKKPKFLTFFLILSFHISFYVLLFFLIPYCFSWYSSYYWNDINEILSGVLIIDDFRNVYSFFSLFWIPIVIIVIYENYFVMKVMKNELVRIVYLIKREKKYVKNEKHKE